MNYNQEKIKGNIFLNNRIVKERLAAAKAAWSESARSNPEALNIDEFLVIKLYFIYIYQQTFEDFFSQFT